MRTVTRKSMLYKSKVEYMSGEGVYTMNHVLGCSHGCKYPCYAYLAAKRFGQVESYEDWREPRLVENTLELLERELAVERREPVGRVHMCFTTDPFMYGQEQVRGLTMDAIDLINRKHGIPITFLTKSAYPAVLSCRIECEDGEKEDTAWFKREDAETVVPPLHPDNEYGISLVSLDEGFREHWEPGAAPYAERIASLKALHDAGCRTWVSIEPWPSPDVYASTFLRDGGGAAKAQAYGSEVSDTFCWLQLFKGLVELLGRIGFADRIVFGRWNYGDAGIHSDYYGACVDSVRLFCEHRNIECVIKSGTAEEGDEGGACRDERRFR